MKFTVKGHMIIPYEYEIEAESPMEAYFKAKKIEFIVENSDVQLPADIPRQIMNFKQKATFTEVHNITPIKDESNNNNV